MKWFLAQPSIAPLCNPRNAGEVFILLLNFAGRVSWIFYFPQMVIALLTDFGTRDYFVGAMKGTILSINPQPIIVDITHEIDPHNVFAASFTLSACYKDFPRKTIFAAIVDPGVGSNRRAILAETKDYFFVAPDNGLLDFVFEECESFRVFELTNSKFFNAKVSQTFHGRDVFAPVAAYLSNDVKPDEFGAEINDFVRLEVPKLIKISANEIEAETIHIDRFGNLVTNLKEADLPENFVLETRGKVIGKRRKFYAEVEADEIFMIAGSAGLLEIAAFQNSAQRLLQAETGDKILLKIKS